MFMFYHVTHDWSYPFINGLCSLDLKYVAYLIVYVNVHVYLNIKLSRQHVSRD